MTSTNFEQQSKGFITYLKKIHSQELQTVHVDAKSRVSRESFQVVDNQGRISLINYAISNKNIPSDEDLKYFDPNEYAKKFSFLFDEIENIKLQADDDVKAQTQKIYSLHLLLAEENLEIYMYPHEFLKLKINNILIQTELKVFNAILRSILPIEHYHIYRSSTEKNPGLAFGTALKSLWGEPTPSQKLLTKYVHDPHVWRNFYHLLKVTTRISSDDSTYFLAMVCYFIHTQSICWTVMGPDRFLNMHDDLGDLEFFKYYCEKFERYKVRNHLKHESQLLIETPTPAPSVNP